MDKNPVVDVKCGKVNLKLCKEKQIWL